MEELNPEEVVEAGRTGNVRAEDITYDWLDILGGITNYTSHVRHFKLFFEWFGKPKGFLEWGCGYSTKYFCDHCEEVVSIELAGDAWILQCEEMYANVKNWRGLSVPVESDMAEVMEAEKPAELECVFVDCAPAGFRGPLVELALSQNVPIIIAHDCNAYDEANCTVYAWSEIKDHSDTHTFFHCSYGSTGFWISNDLTDLQNKFSEYVKL